MNTPPLLRAMRPAQWSKNGLVAAALLFALGDRTQELPPDAWNNAALAVLAFCLLSSSVYLHNDRADIAQDRLHPRKRFRPLASGELSPETARKAEGALLLAAYAPGAWVSPGLVAVLGAYHLLQLAYTHHLKRRPYLDVVAISAGFVLRALAGAVALPVRPSPWLLLCTFALALFLALGKRRQEKAEPHAPGDATRPSLRGVRTSSLDRLLDAALLLACLAYAAYALSADSLLKHGDRRMLLTLPFVLLGLLRYRHLVLREHQGERPERLLFHDPLLVLNSLAYLATLLALFRS